MSKDTSFKEHMGSISEQCSLSKEHENIVEKDAVSHLSEAPVVQGLDEDIKEIIDLLNVAYDKDLKDGYEWLTRITDMPKVISTIIFGYHLPVKPAVAAFLRPFLIFDRFDREVEKVDRWIVATHSLTRIYDDTTMSTNFTAYYAWIGIKEVWRLLQPPALFGPKTAHNIYYPLKGDRMHTTDNPIMFASSLDDWRANCNNWRAHWEIY